ncbi:MAG: hypothetical protein ACOVO2_08530 [Emticicia sp.]|uniref:hypothetical protein n=1 Tax=Emticicia sp. TaxID=1930953 RepID=UPI003BA521CF
MAVRISHCSKSTENYFLCLNDKVSGFTDRSPQIGDLVYLVVKIGKKSLCGARFILDEPTDYKPWKDADNYISAFTIKNIEFCKPFDISILSDLGGKYWAIKFVQRAKSITDKQAIKLLNDQFLSNKIDTLYQFTEEIPQLEIDEDDYVENATIEDEKELQKIIKVIPDAKVSIMGTFQIVPFSNEIDKIKGLETLVNEHFYSLFPQFPKSKTLLIPENRLFKTKGFKIDGNNVLGIRTLPDGILIEFDKNSKNLFRINLIEYECYGERKQKEIEKSSYLNGTIIPQLMRFASAFSIITDEQTRVKTIESWVDKIITYVNNEESQTSKFIDWIKEVRPEIKERSIEREMEKLLIESFKTNLRVVLIIDELSSEQKSTIKNVVSSFKLANGESNVQFTAYVVKLVQKINIVDNNSEYALTIQ